MPLLTPSTGIQACGATSGFYVDVWEFNTDPQLLQQAFLPLSHLAISVEEISEGCYDQLIMFMFRYCDTVYMPTKSPIWKTPTPEL